MVERYVAEASLRVCPRPLTPPSPPPAPPLTSKTERKFTATRTTLLNSARPAPAPFDAPRPTASAPPLQATFKIRPIKLFEELLSSAFGHPFSRLPNFVIGFSSLDSSLFRDSRITKTCNRSSRFTLRKVTMDTCSGELSSRQMKHLENGCVYRTATHVRTYVRYIGASPII